MEASDITVAERICPQHGPYTERTIKVLHRAIITQGCAACREERIAREKALAIATAEAEKAAALKSLLLKTNIPERYSNSTLGNYVACNDYQQSVLDRCRWYLDTWAERKAMGTSMLLLGKPGTGKTHLGCALARNVARFGDSAMFVTVADFLRAVRETYNGGKYTETQVLDRYASPALLVLDEVGTTPGTDHERQMLFELMNRRYSARRPVVMLTNLSLEDIRAYLGERIMDRLRDGGGKLLALNWESYRK